MTMVRPRFAAGQRVSAAGYMYKIVGAMPRDQGVQQYRVRREGESFDRVMSEAALKEVRYE